MNVVLIKHSPFNNLFFENFTARNYAYLNSSKECALGQRSSPGEWRIHYDNFDFAKSALMAANVRLLAELAAITDDQLKYSYIA